MLLIFYCILLCILRSFGSSVFRRRFYLIYLFNSILQKINALLQKKTSRKDLKPLLLEVWIPYLMQYLSVRMLFHSLIYYSLLGITGYRIVMKYLIINLLWLWRYYNNIKSKYIISYYICIIVVISLTFRLYKDSFS